MSGGSQHNPGGRQAQLGPAWNHLQLQVPGYLGRAPQAAHMSSNQGVTWHTPTPPTHLFHPGASTSPDPLQVAMLVRENFDKIAQSNLNHEFAKRHSRDHKAAMKAAAAAGNPLFRHAGTPDREALLYRHSPTPPDKHYRHTPSPGDANLAAGIPPAELFPHLPTRDKLRGEELLGYGRGGVDLTLGRAPPSNGSTAAPLALSVRDAPTINSLIARAQPRPRLDSLLERLAPAPPNVMAPSVVAPSVLAPSVIVPRPPSPTPSHSSEDSDCAKRKRKPERTIKVPTLEKPSDIRNGEQNGPVPPKIDVQHTRRKTRSGSSETIDDIAALIASDKKEDSRVCPKEPVDTEPISTVENLKEILASPDSKNESRKQPHIKSDDGPKTKQDDKMEVDTAPSPKADKTQKPDRPKVDPDKDSAHLSPAKTDNAAAVTPKIKPVSGEPTNVPVESPSEAKPAEPESQVTAEPSATSIVEVENQLEQMFAGIEDAPTPAQQDTEKAVKRKRSRSSRGGKRNPRRISKESKKESKKPNHKVPNASKQKKARTREMPNKDAYDSGSNASSGRSRGPYIQIRGPRESPVCVNVINAQGGEEDSESGANKAKNVIRAADTNVRKRGLHCSTLSSRYDATTADASWVCVFCELGPHRGPGGDLFGPYNVALEGKEFERLSENFRRRCTGEIWFHEDCCIWAPGVVIAGANSHHLGQAVWSCKGTRCMVCGRFGANVSCVSRSCASRAHIHCARADNWRVDEDCFKVFCPAH